MSRNCDTTSYEELCLCSTELVKEENISDPEGDMSAHQHQGEDLDQFERLNNDAVTVHSVKMEEEVKEENISDPEIDMSGCEGDTSSNQHQGEDLDQFEGLNNGTITVCSVKMEEEVHISQAASQQCQRQHKYAAPVSPLLEWANVSTHDTFAMGPMTRNRTG